MTPAKKWYESKTVWFNIAMTLLMAVEANFSLLQAYLGQAYYGLAMFAVTMGNVFLRLITSAPVTLR